MDKEVAGLPIQRSDRLVGPYALLRLLAIHGAGLGVAWLVLFAAQWQAGSLGGLASADRAAASAPGGAIRYVSTTGADSGDCTGPGDPCRTPQYAVDQAGDGDEIRVAGGIYTGVQAYDQVIPTLLFISKTLTLRGGFTTTDWLIPDPNAHSTTLSAQGQGRVVFVSPLSPIIFVLEGFKIADGRAVGPGFPGDPYGGGGIFITQAEATIRNNEIYSNTSLDGGGLAAWGADLHLENNLIRNNSANLDGGGVDIKWSSATLRGNLIIGNYAGWNGGGLTVGTGAIDPLIIDGNKIFSNTSGYVGGAIALRTPLGSPAFSNNFIAHNAATQSGAALIVDGGSTTLVHNTIARNQAGDGSGLFIGESGLQPGHALIENNIIVSHTAAVSVTAGSTATLQGTLWGAGIWANQTDWGGAGTIIVGPNHIWNDPAFEDAAADDFHLKISSPAVDAGVESAIFHDIDGDLRPAGQGFDIGADERLPVLQLAKDTSTPFAEAGALITFTLQVSNTGEQDLHALITDTLPVQMNPTGLLTWTPTITAFGGSWHQVVTATIAPTYTGWLTNLMQVDTQEGPRGEVSVRVTVTNPTQKVYLPAVPHKAVAGLPPAVVEGSVLINNGFCCQGGPVGQTITLHIALSATSPVATVVEMRVLDHGGYCPRASELAAIPWEAFRSQLAVPYHIWAENWVGYYFGAQFRALDGNLSEPVCDDISIEGWLPP